ncbi:GAF domain-containing protein [Anabaena lutea]|uniref:histidine kinase n=1 Tax=Anabaena lutea FACHB-196 TaxID=2692881 RepID=A0ABR8FN41_9NOST|nr:GAF domain-containing protein [Anabaena lutea]MBD2571097.1 GAF domain-containing protein [Anabaena lutea FACHB-196]
MIETEFLAKKTPVDLTNCDKEPIHIPGLIQPHGILLVLQAPNLNIIQVSENIFDILGIPSEDILGKTLKILFNSKQIHLIKQSLAELSETINPLDLHIDTQTGRKNFDGIIHKSYGFIILELELVSPKHDNGDFLSFYSLLQPVICKLQKLSYLDELCQIIVKEIRNLTSFDRVMVYKFDSEGAGEVIAEAKLESLSSFLGLHYPPSDIPKQAKQLYTLNPLRLIPDVNYQAVKIINIDNSVNDIPLNLSGSVLRSVSPIHVEYLKNMGVTASMSISLIREQKLWGLIACHHYSAAKYVPYKLRTVCELLGRVMSLEISAKAENEYLDYKIILKEILSDILSKIIKNENWIEVLSENRSKLLALVGAEGVAICDENKVIMIGKTPVLNEINNICKFLEADIFHQGVSDYLYEIDSLAKIYPEAENFKNVGSGLLAIMISQEYKQYILWFRPEVIQTVNWAGNPHKPVDISEDGTVRLSPRKSFELWQETVKLKSLPWQRCEIEVAKELRNIIVGIVLQKAEEISKIHQQLMLALKAAKMGVWDWDLRQDRIVWSIGHDQLFGLVEPEAIVLKSLVDPRDWQFVNLALNQAFVEQQDYYQEFRVVWPDGSIHWIEGRGKFFLNDAGQAVRFLGTMVEVSDRKLAEIKLQELNADLENRVQNRTLDLEKSQTALQQQIEREQIFMRLTQQIRQSLNLEEILNTAVTQVRNLLAVDRVLFYRITENSSASIIAEAVSNPSLSIINSVHALDVLPPECYQHYLNGEVTIFNNCQNQEVIPWWAANLGVNQVTAQLVVPIIQESHLWGLLITHQCSDRTKCSAEWQPGEIDLLQQLANQIAIAIQQSELYQQLETELRQRQQIETALRRSENLFRSLNEFAPVGIFKTDAQGKMLYCNPCCQEICGFTLEESLGDGWKKFIHPEDLAVFLPQWNAGVDTYQQLSTELRFIHENTTFRICQLVAVPIFSDSSNCMGYVGTVEDITDARNMEKMKNEFISIVSHELRTPLTSIRGCLGLITASTIRNQPEKMQKILQIATSDTERLTRLLNDILDLERLENNKFILNQQYCDASNLINQAMDSMQTIAQENHIDLQSSAISSQVWVDADRIIQVLVNLISNAIKFSPAHTQVKLSVAEMPENYLFKIQDQGRGIPSNKIETIFGKFQQVDASDSRQKGGTGLGLAICSRIIQQHGGKIWVESVLGKGSTFYFSLPKQSQQKIAPNL